jgi:cardiolipin synthase
MVRKMSRRSSRTLLIAGAEIYDYQPSMIHAKLLTVDGQWSVVGSTNFDHRSFALNDEVNLAVLDRKLAEVIDGDFFEDLKRSRRLSKAMLQKSDGMSAGMLDYAMKKES